LFYLNGFRVLVVAYISSAHSVFLGPGEYTPDLRGPISQNNTSTQRGINPAIRFTTKSVFQSKPIHPTKLPEGLYLKQKRIERSKKQAIISKEKDIMEVHQLNTFNNPPKNQ